LLRDGCLVSGGWLSVIEVELGFEAGTLGGHAVLRLGQLEVAWELVGVLVRWVGEEGAPGEESSARGLEVGCPLLLEVAVRVLEEGAVHLDGKTLIGVVVDVLA